MGGAGLLPAWRTAPFPWRITPAKYADLFSAMGTEPRLRIMQLLLSAHPDGPVVGEIQEELDIPNSTSNNTRPLRTNYDLFIRTLYIFFVNDLGCVIRAPLGGGIRT
jgi:hypothetical protein